MDYKVMISEFEGPMDLLLHLIKKSDINICDLKIEVITKQYLDYINEMEKLNLDIASEYLVLAAELIEIKSSLLLPIKEVDKNEEEDDPREKLIARLLEYQQYKEVTPEFKSLEKDRKQIFTKCSSNLKEFKIENKEINLGDVDLDNLLEAFQKFLDRKKLEEPISTKITKKEYSVNIRSNEIKEILKNKRKICFEELFEILTKDYVVVTFLSILDLAKKQVVDIIQDDNFNSIVLTLKGSE